ncbi:MAG: L,D-transpeptidase family protein [Synergistaceae bacterium]|nr:L,D-transpeptidase family protein [Synergistaceae bacterium]
MKKFLIAFFVLFIACGANADTIINSINAAEDAEQLVIVSGTKGSNANFYFYEKNSDGEWNEIISCPAYIGKKGWGKTREGDLKTPRGVFHFTMAFGINDDPGCEIGYTKVDETHYWVGDSNSEKYNQFVSTRDYKNFNQKDSEHIIDYDLAYKYCLNISYNENGTPGKGSAIFLHCYTKNKFTGGCVAIPEEKMIEVLRHVKNNCVVVMDERKNLKKY